MENSIPNIIKKNYKIFGNKKILFHNNLAITYKDIFFKVQSESKKINNLDIKKGDRICICMKKSIDQVIVILSVLNSGLVFVPILPQLKKDNVSHIIKNSGAKYIFCDQDRVSEIEKKFHKKIIFISNQSLEIKQRIKRKRKFKILKNDPAVIIYSSGSTGMPKGIVVPHINLVKGAQIVSKYLKTKTNDKIIAILSFNFDYGLNQLWQSLLIGCQLFLYDYLLPNDFFKFIRQKKINILPVMPVLIKMFSNKSKRHISKKIKYICTSGGPIDLSSIKNLKRLFPNSKIYLMYGLTEAFRSTFLNPKKIFEKFDSIGQAIPTVKIHVLNKKYKDCKINEPGELVHRGGCISLGYYKNARKNKKVFRKIKRFKDEIVVFSGDIVKKDEDGDIYFIGRKDNMIKTSGYRVSPTEVENQINKIRNIEFSLVTSIKDSLRGQKIICAYTTVNKKKLNEFNLIKDLETKLPKYMIPINYKHYKSFQITGNQGKLKRNEIIKQLIKDIDQNK